MHSEFMSTPLQTRIDTLITQLYGNVLRVAPESYRAWALEQLHQVLDFDAALWGTGLLASRTVHYVVHIGLEDAYSQALLDTLDINPIRQGILGNMGQPVAMSDMLPDDEFYQSAIYQRLFAPYGIERILGSGHFEPRSGLSTLISLYRRDRHADFSAQDRYCMARLLPHLMGAATHAYFLHLECKQTTQTNAAAAICDQHGFYYEVQERFLDLIDAAFPGYQGQCLPFAMPTAGNDQVNKHWVASATPMGKLFVVYLRPVNPLDMLTEREKEIVLWITRGLSFKEVAKKLEVAPSTVSNHLYRIYRKLGVTSRTELARIMLGS